MDRLADRLGTTDVDGLAQRLAADPRVLVLEAPVAPTLSALSASRAAAYDRALRAAGMRPFRRVVLLQRTPLPGGGVAALLRATTARLLAVDPGAHALADAGERANRAMMAMLPAAAAAPPTTHPPGPPPRR